MAPFSSVLCVDEKLVNHVKKSFEKTDEDIARDVLILSEWWRKQAHFPKTIDEDWLQRILMRNKFRVEQTKQKLEAYFTLRTIHKESFSIDDFHPKSDNFKRFMRSVLLYPSAKTTKEGLRIYIFKFNDPNPDIYEFRFLMKWIYVIAEVLLSYDFVVGDRVIFDVGDFQMGHFLKINPNDLVKIFALWQEGFSGRIHRMDFVNSPSFINLLTKLVAPLLKKGKICLHDSYESLYKDVPKENLPEEMGGTEGKIRELRGTSII